MKHLRQYIRQILLTEGMVSAADLPKNIGICIKPGSIPSWLEIKYCELDANGKIKKYFGARSMRKAVPPPISGEIVIGPVSHQGTGFDCDGAWEIIGSEAASGYGPLLYDIAMEIATLRGSGLVSDREDVSPEAHKVWKFYLDNRTGPGGDVKVFQCDDRENSLTPDPSDNIDQRIAKNAYGYDTTEWTNHPLSKRYSKDPTTIKALGDRIKWL